eukprot:TRINITY_DN15631_c0_g1_i1.p1 TRINITY_DN15631_c0_g1~~TRINITY_DN15631_c0_g1_i1.p1  ORF type:complete len:444 (+),score=139.39 TRINITY_DN15631_c0_g1_i1:698-2029(+)
MTHFWMGKLDLGMKKTKKDDTYGVEESGNEEESEEKEKEDYVDEYGDVESDERVPSSQYCSLDEYLAHCDALSSHIQRLFTKDFGVMESAMTSSSSEAPATHLEPHQPKPLVDDERKTLHEDQKNELQRLEEAYSLTHKQWMEAKIARVLSEPDGFGAPSLDADGGDGDLQSQVRTLYEEYCRLADQNAELWTGSVLRGDYYFKLARNQEYISRQRKILDHLVRYETSHVSVLNRLLADRGLRSYASDVLNALSNEMKRHLIGSEDRQKRYGELVADHRAHLKQHHAIDLRDPLYHPIAGVLLNGGVDSSKTAFLSRESMVNECANLVHRIHDAEASRDHDLVGLQKSVETASRRCAMLRNAVEEFHADHEIPSLLSEIDAMSQSIERSLESALRERKTHLDAMDRRTSLRDDKRLYVDFLLKEDQFREKFQKLQARVSSHSP